MKNHSGGFHLQELESHVSFVQDASAGLKALFFQQFICRLMSPETGCKLTPQKCMDSEGGPGLVHDLVPSVAFQFILDMHFLLEITRFGDYFSTNPLVPATLMKSVTDLAGLDPTRDADDGWIMKAAIEKLVKIEEIETPSDDELVGTSVEEPPENHHEHASETLNDDSTHFSEDSLMLEENAATKGALEVSIGKGNANLNAELNQQSPDLLKDKGCFINNGATCPTDAFGNMEDIESGNAAYDKFHFDQETILPHLLFSETVTEASELGLPTEDVSIGQHNEAKVFVCEQEDDGKMKLPGSEIVSGEIQPVYSGVRFNPSSFFSELEDSVKNK